MDWLWLLHEDCTKWFFMYSIEFPYFKENSLSQDRVSLIKEESKAGSDCLEKAIDNEVVDEGQVGLPLPRVLLGPDCKQYNLTWTNDYLPIATTCLQDPHFGEQFQLL